MMKIVAGLIVSIFLCADFSFGQSTGGLSQQDSKDAVKNLGGMGSQNLAAYDEELSNMLATIRHDDQRLRGKTKSFEVEFGRESDEWKLLWKTIEEQDSINLLKVKAILDTKGWLGEDVVGWEGNQTLFLVIQHANLPDQLKYLPMMRKAVEEGNAFAYDLAMLEDRVALRQGKKQIYGSQVSKNPKTGKYFILPIEDPDYVDQRREALGLESMQDYLTIWNLVWNVEDHKKDRD